MTFVERLKSWTPAIFAAVVFTLMFLLATVAYMLVAKIPVAQFVRLFGFSFIAGALGTKVSEWSKLVGSWFAKLLKLV